MLQMSGNALQQVEKLKCLAMVFSLRVTEGERSSAWALSLCGHKTGAFKHRRAVSFQIGLCSDPYLWSWIL